MRSSILALTVPVWRRYRWGFAACAAVWLALVAAVQALPRSVWVPGPEDGPLAPAHFLFLIFTFVPVAAFAVCVFAFAEDAHLETRESNFPRRLFLLPVATPTLVFWPMAQAAATTALLWIAWDLGVCRPAGLDLPLAWPAFLAAAVTAWLQVVAWSPFPVTGLRIFAGVLPALAAWIPTAVIQRDAPPAVASAGLAALLPAAYLVALYGVRRARRGDTPHWTWPGRVSRWVVDRLPWRRTGFASPVEAQAWFEWRLRGWALPMVAGILLLVWLPLFPLWGGAMQNLVSDEVTPTLKAVVGWLSAPGLLLVLTVTGLTLYAGALGADFGGMAAVGQRARPAAAAVLHPQLALKPLTARGFVLAKWRAAARGVLVAWGMVLVPVVVALAATGQLSAIVAAPAFRGYGPAGAAGLLAALAAAAVAGTWLLLVGGIWVGLWNKGVLSILIHLAALLAWPVLGYAAYWLWTHPDWWPLVPPAVVAAVVLKLLLAPWLVRALVRGGHAAVGEVALAAAAWLAFVAACVALVLALVPPGRVSPAAVALAAAVLVPFNRVAAAPLLLARNRHG